MAKRPRSEDRDKTSPSRPTATLSVVPRSQKASISSDDVPLRDKHRKRKACSNNAPLGNNARDGSQSSGMVSSSTSARTPHKYDTQPPLQVLTGLAADGLGRFTDASSPSKREVERPARPRRRPPGVINVADIEAEDEIIVIRKPPKRRHDSCNTEHPSSTTEVIIAESEVVIATTRVAIQEQVDVQSVTTDSGKSDGVVDVPPAITTSPVQSNTDDAVTLPPKATPLPLPQRKVAFTRKKFTTSSQMGFAFSSRRVQTAPSTANEAVEPSTSNTMGGVLKQVMPEEHASVAPNASKTCSDIQPSQTPVHLTPIKREVIDLDLVPELECHKGTGEAALRDAERDFDLIIAEHQDKIRAEKEALEQQAANAPYLTRKKKPGPVNKPMRLPYSGLNPTGISRKASRYRRTETIGLPMAFDEDVPPEEHMFQQEGQARPSDKRDSVISSLDLAFSPGTPLGRTPTSAKKKGGVDWRVPTWERSTTKQIRAPQPPPVVESTTSGQKHKVDNHNASTSPQIEPAQECDDDCKSLLDALEAFRTTPTRRFSDGELFGGPHPAESLRTAQEDSTESARTLKSSPVRQEPSPKSSPVRQEPSPGTKEIPTGPRAHGIAHGKLVCWNWWIDKCWLGTKCNYAHANTGLFTGLYDQQIDKIVCAAAEAGVLLPSGDGKPITRRDLVGDRDLARQVYDSVRSAIKPVFKERKRKSNREYDRYVPEQQHKRARRSRSVSGKSREAYREEQMRWRYP